MNLTSVLEKQNTPATPTAPNGNEFTQMVKMSPDMGDIVNTVRSHIRIARFNLGFDNYHIQKEFQPNKDRIDDICNKLKELGWQRVCSSNYYYLWTYGLHVVEEQGEQRIISRMDPEVYAAVSLDVDSSQYTVFAIGSQESSESVLEVFKEYLPNIDATFTHYYLNENGLDSDSIRLNTDDHRKPMNSFYPWLKEVNKSIDEFLDEYIRSEEAVLILSGLPGTGKTTIIRELVKRTKTNIGYTADTNLMSSPNALFARINSGDIDMMIFEDSDMILQYSREQGNKSVSQLLNTADGLIPNKNNRIKLVFTTNITDKKLIDKALLRPGRLFAYVNCGKLSSEEAKVVAKDLNVDFTPQEGKEYTLAEIAHARTDRVDNESTTGKVFGFVARK
nr:MAG TPA: ATPase [Caudoviricetes sp.]